MRFRIPAIVFSFVGVAALVGAVWFMPGMVISEESEPVEAVETPEEIAARLAADRQAALDSLLAPYVGLFGTVIGIIRAFQAMAEHGAGGFEVVAAGISEALVATAAGLFVAIVALMFFNYLQVRAGAIGATYARCCERFVQALLYVETASLPEGETSGAFAPAS